MSGRLTRRVVQVATAEGTARAHVTRPASARGTLVLGHGAGGGIEAPDLQAVTAAVADAGWAVVLVEQPWRVAGRRIATAPPRLDAAWVEVVAELRSGRGALPGPLVLGGRSAGARVACRTCGALGAQGVVALAFPLHPPGRPAAATRAAKEGELRQAASGGRPLLVVQGRRDPFGSPGDVTAACPAARVLPVDGDHALAADTASVAGAVVAFLAALEPRRP